MNATLKFVAPMLKEPRLAHCCLWVHMNFIIDLIRTFYVQCQIAI